MLRIIYAAQILAFTILWYLFKGRFKRYSPNLVYLYCVMQCGTTILSVNDMLPEFMLNPDRKTDE